MFAIIFSRVKPVLSPVTEEVNIMRTIETVIRRVLFFGSFAVMALAALEKVMNLLNYTLLKGYYSPLRLLEFAAIGLLFTIVMQLHEIRLSLASKSPEAPK
jgi:hypothetical protein